MFRTPSRVLAGLMLFGLLGAAMVVPAGATVRSGSAQGITDDQITVVALVSDLDGLRNQGINLPEKLTTGNLLNRWSGYADSFCRRLADDGVKGVKASGGSCTINGREIVVEPAVWNPIDATTFDEACTQATQDNDPFVVVNGNGYRQSSLACITVDNQTPMFYGESVYGDLQKASGNRLVSLGLQAETNAKVTASLLEDADLVPKTAKIGILTGNEPGVKAASDGLESELNKKGYDVVETVETNLLSADNALINRETATAVETFKAAGADTVFIFVPFTGTNGYYQEVERSGAGFDNFIVDASSSLCTQFGASRTPAEVVGVPCITTWDTRALPTKDGVKADNEFEAECREDFDSFTGEESQPGVPAGDTTAGGVTYTEDLPPNECTIMSVLVPAIAKAGKNPTWDKVYNNIVKTGKGPAAYMSNGEGQFTKKKPFYATQVHIETLNTASPDTPVAADGTFNGCPAPVNCWVPMLIDGQEWFSV